MHLNRRNADRGDGVADRHAVMGVAGGVDDDRLKFLAGLADLLDYFPFPVKLDDFELYPFLFGQFLQRRVYLFQGKVRLLF